MQTLHAVRIASVLPSQGKLSTGGLKDPQTLSIKNVSENFPIALFSKSYSHASPSLRMQTSCETTSRNDVGICGLSFPISIFLSVMVLSSFSFFYKTYCETSHTTPLSNIILDYSNFTPHIFQ